MSKISIIANFYKSEKFIPKLIDSVIAQTYQDWELVCVNDCSPWGDLNVLRKYANKEPRILIINNEENMGISKAKFEGIKYATGKYLMFIDGDDWLEPEALERCIEPAEKNDVDMVVMSSQKVLYRFIAWKKVKSINRDVNRIIAQPELFDKYYINFFGINMFSVTYWGKLIRRDAFDRANLRPSEKDYSEDEIFNMLLFPHLRSMYMLDYVGYNWRWGGITSGRLANNVERTIKLLTFVLDFYEQRLQLLDLYQYERGYQFLTIELVNYLVANVSDVASKDLCPPQLVPLLKKYINTINEHTDYLAGCNGSKYDAVFSGDVEMIYSYCRQSYKKRFIEKYIKRIIHSIID